MYRLSSMHSVLYRRPALYAIRSALLALYTKLLVGEPTYERNPLVPQYAPANSVYKL